MTPALLLALLLVFGLGGAIVLCLGSLVAGLCCLALLGFIIAAAFAIHPLLGIAVLFLILFGGGGERR